jgi:hypothetical protein
VVLAFALAELYGVADHKGRTPIMSRMTRKPSSGPVPIGFGVTAGSKKATTMARKFPAAGLLAITVLGSLAAARFGVGWAAASPSKTMVVYAFNINPSRDDLIPARGTRAGVVSEGDVAIINDQLTSTHFIKGGYPIIGYDSGTCTFTRIAPDGQGKGSPNDNVVENCVATATLPHGTVTVEGTIVSKSGTPEPATLAVTGGTGSHDGAHGIVKVKFGAKFDTFTIVLQ